MSPGQAKVAARMPLVCYFSHSTSRGSHDECRRNPHFAGIPRLRVLAQQTGARVAISKALGDRGQPHWPVLAVGPFDRRAGSAAPNGFSGGSPFGSDHEQSAEALAPTLELGGRSRLLRSAARQDSEGQGSRVRAGGLDRSGIRQNSRGVQEAQAGSPLALACPLVGVVVDGLLLDRGPDRFVAGGNSGRLGWNSARTAVVGRGTEGSQGTTMEIADGGVKSSRLRTLCRAQPQVALALAVSPDLVVSPGTEDRNGGRGPMPQGREPAALPPGTPDLSLILLASRPRDCPTTSGTFFARAHRAALHRHADCRDSNSGGRPAGDRLIHKLLREATLPGRAVIFLSISPQL